MGEFGWAYVKGALTASGPTGSLQFRDDDSGGSTGITGSAALIFITGAGSEEAEGPYELRLTGTLTVKGDSFLSGNLTVLGDTTTISASHLIIEDPVIGLGFGTGTLHTGAIGDRGFIFGLRTNSNQAIIWDQSSGSFVIGKVGAIGPDRTAYDVPEGDLTTLKVGGIIASGSSTGRGEVFGYNLRTSGDLTLTGSVETELGTISASKGIFTLGLTSSAEILASGNIRTNLGTISGTTVVASKIGAAVLAPYGSFSGSSAIFAGRSLHQKSEPPCWHHMDLFLALLQSLLGLAFSHMDLLRLPAHSLAHTLFSPVVPSQFKLLEMSRLLARSPVQALFSPVVPSQFKLLETLRQVPLFLAQKVSSLPV